MKPKIYRNGLTALVTVLCLGVFVSAIVQANDYDSIKGPIVTQASIASTLYQSTKASSNETPTAPSTKSTQLSKTGPGNIIVLYTIISLISYGAAIAHLRVKL